MIKHYGKLIFPSIQLNDEKVARITKGIIKKEGHYYCIQCGNEDNSYMSKYYSPFLDKEIIYCRRCIQLGRIDSITDYRITESTQLATEGEFELPFTLSKQQQYASDAIIKAIKNSENLLLYAVTGAGKTEMMFDGISLARQLGHNVAILSPRVDVVIEISHRIKEAFKNEEIDILHQKQSQKYNGHFVIATVHQLYRFKQHFDTIFIDEVDAFPLSMDPNLLLAIDTASKTIHSHIYMTATPPRQLIKQMSSNKIIKLPARFHRQPLPVPRFKYFKLNTTRVQPQFIHLLQTQIKQQRYTLVFFNHIETMKNAYLRYRAHIPNLICVYSEDVYRFEKVEALRRGEHSIVFTTTILERGFTMARLDVIVINAETFSKAALIQIAGRVGRKIEEPNGLVLFLHEGVSLSMMSAKKDITKMNRLGYKRGWLDA